MKFLVYRSFLLVALLWVGVSSGFAQSEPYYKLPKDRTDKGTMTFPNLKPLLTKFYLRGEGGFLLQGSRFSNDFDGKLSTNTPVNTNWAASFGFNYRDIWMTEIGYAKTPLQLSSVFQLNPFVIPIIEQYELNGVSLKYQRSVFVVDRIARTTRLFIGGGVIINTNGKATEVSNSSEAFLRRFNQITADTIRLAENTQLATTPLLGELSVELRGKLAESVEIGVFTKIVTSFTQPFRTNISYRINDTPAIQTTHSISPLAFRLGVSVHYNFGIITKYESDLE